jgi:ElaB/YqjD/DUF883 family membrane-anchored ribosome-binding protein
MNVLARHPHRDPVWLQRALRDASDLTNGYAESHPWQLAAAGAALGIATALLLRRIGGRRQVQPRDYSDGG